MSFNTAVSSMMIAVNEFEKEKNISKKVFEDFIKVLSPFIPHITEELWELMGNKGSYSMPIHFLFVCSQAMRQVPDPMKPSNTVLLILVLLRIKCRMRGTGLVVGWRGLLFGFGYTMTLLSFDFRNSCVPCHPYAMSSCIGA
jgi:hypothetical protein